MANKPLKNPENYAPAHMVAKDLREIANNIEQGRGSWYHVSIQFWSASSQRVYMSLVKKLGEEEGVKAFNELNKEGE